MFFKFPWRCALKSCFQILEKYSLFFISTLILSSFGQVSSVVGRGHTSSPLAADITHWPEESITNLEGSWPHRPQRTNRQSDWLVGILVHFDKNENNVLKYEYEYDWIDQDLKKENKCKRKFWLITYHNILRRKTRCKLVKTWDNVVRNRWDLSQLNKYQILNIRY